MNAWFAITFLSWERITYAFPAPDASAEDLLDEIMPEGHDERDEDRPSMIHDFTHLRKRHRGMIVMLVRRRSRCLLRGGRTRSCGSVPPAGRTRPWLTISARAI